MELCIKRVRSFILLLTDLNSKKNMVSHDNSIGETDNVLAKYSLEWYHGVIVKVRRTGGTNRKTRCHGVK
jgi:hypothetical protein